MRPHSRKTPKDLSIIGGPTPSRLTGESLDSFHASFAERNRRLIAMPLNARLGRS
jgi:hypothetical protein